MDLAELMPTVGAHPRVAWRAAGPAPGHEDCNGRMPSIAKDVFTKMDDRRSHGEDEDEMDYVSGAGVDAGPEGRRGRGSRWVSRGRAQNCHLRWSAPGRSPPSLPGSGGSPGLAGRVRRSSSGPSLLAG